MADYNAYLARRNAKSQQTATTTITSLPITMADAFTWCDNIQGNNNFVSLIALRATLSGDRTTQDAMIAAARSSGVYTLTPCDRYCSPSERANEYTDAHGDTFHYISRR